IHTESCFACGDLHEIGLQVLAVSLNFVFSGSLAFVGKAMKQVSESFRVHEAVLDRGFEHFEQLRMSFARMVQRRFDCGIELIADACVVTLHVATRRPVEWTVGGKTSADRIDAECEELIEGRIERTESKRTAT